MAMVVEAVVVAVAVASRVTVLMGLELVSRGTAAAMAGAEMAVTRW